MNTVSYIRYMHHLKVPLYVAGSIRRLSPVVERHVVQMMTSVMVNTIVEATKSLYCIAGLLFVTALYGES
jgi:hypothetical protein